MYVFTFKNVYFYGQFAPRTYVTRYSKKWQKNFITADNHLRSTVIIHARIFLKFSKINNLII